MPHEAAVCQESLNESLRRIGVMVHECDTAIERVGRGITTGLVQVVASTPEGVHAPDVARILGVTPAKLSSALAALPSIITLDPQGRLAPANELSYAAGLLATYEDDVFSTVAEWGRRRRIRYWRSQPPSAEALAGLKAACLGTGHQAVLFSWLAREDVFPWLLTHRRSDLDDLFDDLGIVKRVLIHYVVTASEMWTLPQLSAVEKARLFNDLALLCADVDPQDVRVAHLARRALAAVHADLSAGNGMASQALVLQAGWYTAVGRLAEGLELLRAAKAYAQRGTAFDLARAQAFLGFALVASEQYREAAFELSAAVEALLIEEPFYIDLGLWALQQCSVALRHEWRFEEAVCHSNTAECYLRDSEREIPHLAVAIDSASGESWRLQGEFARAELYLNCAVRTAHDHFGINSRQRGDAFRRYHMARRKDSRWLAEVKDAAPMYASVL